MNNRLGWFLLLMGIILFGFIYLFFFFLPNKVEEKKIEEQIAEEQIVKISLKKIEEEIVEKPELTNSEIIENIKEKQKYYDIINLDWEKFYFSILNNELHLTNNDRTIGVFNLANQSTLNVSNIYNSSDYYIAVWEEKFIYNSTSLELYNIWLKLDVDYIKFSNDKYLIKTVNGTFVYSKDTKKTEYFTFFNDFVDYNDWYVWIINKDDNSRIKNLGINLNQDYAIFYYNPETKEKNIIFQTDKILNKIYLKDEKLIFEDENGEMYFLENYFK